MKVSSSFLASKKIEATVKKLSFTDVDFIHVDFIDDSYVIGTKVPFRKIKKASKNLVKRLDVHLMTKKVKKYIKKFAELNVEYITFHVELDKNTEKYINLIHSYGIKAGLAINPDTDIEKIKPYLSMIDMILVMSVVPGLGGQEFLTQTVDKLKKLKKYIVDNELDLVISVDGGINNETVKKVNKYTDIIVSGSYITNSDDFQKQISSLR